MAGAGDVTCHRQGAAGRITLNRPGAMNALTHDMCLAIAEALHAWMDDGAVDCVVIEGAGDRAFCAGADIKALHALGAEGRVEECRAFFRDEYRLNQLIKRYPKPTVAVIDGTTMGGGVGLSAHADHIVATERTAWAMPETAIGLFPDVGATYVLPRLPGAAGMWLGLTGARLDGLAVFQLGLATALMEAGKAAELIGALADGGAAALPANAARTGPPDNWPDNLEATFGQDSVPAILAALRADGGDWAFRQAAAIRAASPTSVLISFEALRRGADLSFEDCLRQEMRLAARCMQGHDFFEGVRAQVIDKDRQPKWSPATLDDVDDAEIASYFAPLDAEWELCGFASGG